MEQETKNDLMFYIPWIVLLIVLIFCVYYGLNNKWNKHYLIMIGFSIIIVLGIIIWYSKQREPMNGHNNKKNP
jgi:predicted RND superfamily exporter protein